jgi:hypothetical protein
LSFERGNIEMNAPRIYKQATIFNGRATGMRNLWEPSTTYKGKPQEKPNYLFSFIVPKTRGHWSEEAQFAGFAAAAQELYQQALAHIPFPQIVWPVKDGDLPPERGKPPIEWCRGHWFLTGSSSSPIETNIVQAGVPVKIMNRTVVKPGDFCAVGVALAVNSNTPNAVKVYVNSVLFTAPSEEIAVGNNISGAELMSQAKAQGLNVTGFGAPQSGFTSQSLQPGFGANLQGALSAPMGQPNGFGGAPAPLQPPQGQFTTPGGFEAPQGFPQR